MSSYNAQDSNISKEDFNAWESVRVGGLVNMADTWGVSSLSGLSVEKCRYILRNYVDLMNKYGEEQ